MVYLHDLVIFLWFVRSLSIWAIVELIFVDICDSFEFFWPCLLLFHIYDINVLKAFLPALDISTSGDSIFDSFFLFFNFLVMIYVHHVEYQLFFEVGCPYEVFYFLQSLQLLRVFGFWFSFWIAGNGVGRRNDTVCA